MPSAVPVIREQAEFMPLEQTAASTSLYDTTFSQSSRYWSDQSVTGLDGWRVI